MCGKTEWFALTDKTIYKWFVSTRGQDIKRWEASTLLPLGILTLRAQPQISEVQASMLSDQHGRSEAAEKRS